MLSEGLVTEGRPVYTFSHVAFSILRMRSPS